MELSLNIDEYGRTTSAAPVINHKHSPLDYRTNTILFDNFDERFCDTLIQDCKATACPEGLPLTFWLSMQDKPRCLLEKLAKDVFEHHLKDESGLDPKISGCEWWVQMRPSPNKKRLNSDSPEAQRGIQFHWDKDESLRDVGGFFVHPHVSTVTYLTDHGAPTMVFEKSMPDDGLMDRDIKGAYISWPRRGKHLSFDGRFLHGAPSNLLESADLSSEIRVTFLVNIWLHHKPLGVERFPESLLRTFSTSSSNNNEMKTIMPSKPLCFTLHTVLEDATSSLVDFTWGLGDLVSIHAKLPIDTIRSEQKTNENNGNISIEWVSNSSMAKIRARINQ